MRSARRAIRLSPDLSICIVSYNCRDLLASCLRSIAETAVGLEVETIVVDNASADDTLEMLARDFPQVRVIASEENLGFAAGTNRAVEAASGEVLLLLNPDTEVRPGALRQLTEFVASHPEVGACGPAVYGPEGELQPTCRAFPRLWLTVIAQLGLHRLFRRSRTFGAYEMTWWDHADARAVDWLSGVCIATRRSVWERVGPLDASYFMYAEDLDWCYRLAQAALERWYLPDAEMVHHEGGSWGDASAERILAAHRATFRFFGKHHGHLAEVLQRILVAWGGLARGSFWNIMGPVLGENRELISSYEVHFRVVEVAMAMDETWRETKDRRA